MPINPKRRAVSSRSPFVLHIAGVFTSPLRLLHRLAYALPPHPSPRVPIAGGCRLARAQGAPPFFALAGDRGVPPFFGFRHECYQRRTQHNIACRPYSTTYYTPDFVNLTAVKYHGGRNYDRRYLHSFVYHPPNAHPSTTQYQPNSPRNTHPTNHAIPRIYQRFPSRCGLPAPATPPAKAYRRHPLPLCRACASSLYPSQWRLRGAVHLSPV